MAAIIRFFSRSKYSHVSLAFKNGDLYEAVPFKGCRKSRLKSTEGVSAMMFKHGATVDSALVKSYLETELGTRYDYCGVVSFLCGLKPSSKRMFCSEYVFNALRAGGVELQERTEGRLLRPDQLAMSPILMRDYALEFQWKENSKHVKTV